MGVRIVCVVALALVACMKEGYAQLDSVQNAPLGGTIRFAGPDGWDFAQKKMAEVCGGEGRYDVGDSHLEQQVDGVTTQHHAPTMFTPATSVGRIDKHSDTVLSFRCR